MEHNGIVPPRARLRDAEGERMTRVNDYPLLIEFVPGTRISREPEVVSKLPIVQNGPPGTSVVFGDGATVPLPTDQIVFAEDGGGAARVGFGGMSFEGMEAGQLVFLRVRDLQPEELGAVATSTPCLRRNADTCPASIDQCGSK